MIFATVKLDYYTHRTLIRMSRSLFISLHAPLINPSKFQLVYVQHLLCTFNQHTPCSIRYTVLDDNSVIRTDRIHGRANNLKIISNISQLDYNEHELDVTIFLKTMR